MPITTGTVLGRYRLLEKAGVGGMSEVWKAEDETLKRTVAVKVIFGPVASESTFRERFLREARLVAGLEHPNVLPVFDYGTATIDGEEVSYLVMPLVAGGSLKGRVAGPVPPALAVTWLSAMPKVVRRSAMRHAGFLAVPFFVLGLGAAAEDIPPAEEQAKATLEKSPRHGEWIDVKMPAGGAPIRTWVVYPERKEKAGVVLVIHEIFGLSDWIRAVADQLAKEGFIAVAPDLLSGKGPGGGGTESAASRDDVVKLIQALTPEETTARLNAVREWAIKLPSANARSATTGFCWGGSASFAYAAAQPLLNAAVVYYGTAPPDEALAAIKAPVLGNYGGDDARVTATVAPTKEAMKKAGKSYEARVYEGAGHGFLRQQTGKEGANLKATRAAWPRTIAFLKDALK